MSWLRWFRRSDDVSAYPSLQEIVDAEPTHWHEGVEYRLHIDGRWRRTSDEAGLSQGETPQ